MYIKDSKNKTDDECLDEIYAFFINCYHLKDWIKNSRPDLDQGVKNLFDKKSGKECLQICADFANGLKHLELNNFKIDPNTKVDRQDVKIGASELPCTTKYKWFIKVQQEQYEMFALAIDCIKEWESFFREKGLEYVQTY